MAPYGRNLEAAQDFEVELVAGANEISIWFDDLAERDARYFFQLDYLDGPGGRAGAADRGRRATIAAAMEAALDAMHFERPAYGGGEVALVTDAPLPVAAGCAVDDRRRLHVDREADVILRRARSRREPPADRRLPKTLPADFRHFKVSLVDRRLHRASRVFGVEICHADAAGHGTGQRLPTGSPRRWTKSPTTPRPTRCGRWRGWRPGAAARRPTRMIAGALPAIEDCHDCADFILVPLLWCRHAYRRQRSRPSCASASTQAILSYRYWMDEPGNDVQWYFSENHALLFHTAAYLAGHFLPEARLSSAPGAPAPSSRRSGSARVRAWLDHFEQWEMAEFNSAPYFPIDLKGLTALFALAPDADVRRRAGAAIVRLLEIVARSAHQGMLTGAQGRSYEHTLRAARSLELSGIARMLWGKGNYGRRFHALPQLALCLRDHGLELPAKLGGHRLSAGRRRAGMVLRAGPGPDRQALSLQDPRLAMGTAAAYRWNEWGYQETVLHLRLGDNPDAQIWINHPGETIHSGYGRPSYWGGSGTLPRVHQYRGLAVDAVRLRRRAAGLHPCLVPARGVRRSVRRRRAWRFARSGDADRDAEGRAARFELVTQRPDRRQRAAPARPQGGLDRAARRDGVRNTMSPEHSRSGFRQLALSTAKTSGFLHVDDPEYGDGAVPCDGRIEAEGRIVDPATWTVGRRGRVSAGRRAIRSR